MGASPFSKQFFLCSPDCVCLLSLQSTLKAFATIPLTGGVDFSQFVVFRRHSDTAPATLPFDLSSHCMVKDSHIAAVTLERFREDVAFYSREYNASTEPQLLKFEASDIEAYFADPQGAATSQALEHLQKLINALHDLASQDADYVTKMISVILSGLNSSVRSDQQIQTRPGTQEDAVIRAKIGHSLACRAGQETPLWFELLVALMLSSQAEHDLRLLSPLCSLEGAQTAIQLTLSVLFHANRMSQARRCSSQARDLMVSMQKLRVSSGTATAADWTALRLQGQTLASALTASRTYVHVNNPESPTKATFDPRFLVFEFTHSILLRPKQVDLVSTILQTVGLGNSSDVKKTSGVCHQVTIFACCC